MGTTNTLILIANCTFLVPSSSCAQDTPRAQCFSHTERTLYLSLSAALLDFSSNLFEAALVFSYVGAGRHRSGILDWRKPLHTLAIQCNGHTFVTTFTSETMHFPSSQTYATTTPVHVHPGTVAGSTLSTSSEPRKKMNFRNPNAVVLIDGDEGFMENAAA